MGSLLSCCLVRLTRFYARNILTFGAKGFEWNGIGSLNIVVGPNGSGKTNILRLLQLVGNAFYLGRPGGPLALFSSLPLKDSLIEVGIELTDEEQTALVDLLLASIKLQAINWQPQSVDQNEAERIVRYLMDSRRDLFASLIGSRVTLCIATHANFAHPLDVYAKIGDSHHPLYVDLIGIREVPQPLSGWQPIELKKLLFQEFQKSYSNVAKAGPKVALASERQLRKVARSLGKSWLRQRFVGQAGAPLPSLLRLDALALTQYEVTQGTRPSDILRLRSFLIEREWTAQQIGVIDLLGVIYRSAIVRLSDMRFRPSDLPLPSPPSESDRQQVRTIDGVSLAIDMFDLKNNPIRDRRDLYKALTEFYERLTKLHPDVVQYPMTVSERQTSRYTSVRIAGPGYEVPVDFAAAGQVELLVFLYALNSTRNGVLLLDEPALNLHPAFQKQVFVEMVTRSKKQGNQLLVVTHSPSFVGIDKLETISRLSPNKDGQSVLNRIPARTPRRQAQNKKWLSRYPDLLSALFARGVLLVEGSDEAAGLPIWFRKCAGRDLLAEQGIPVISVDGKTIFRHFSDVLDAWAIPFRVIGDGDAARETSYYGSRGRSYPQRDFVDIFKKYNIREFRKALRTIGTGEKDAAVAREVALQTRPPPPIRALWRWLKPFVADPAN